MSTGKALHPTVISWFSVKFELFNSGKLREPSLGNGSITVVISQLIRTKRNASYHDK